MTTWFTSDHHFYHNNIITYCSRPYRSADQMNRDMIARWNEVVQPTDLVYYLGDFSMSMRGIEGIVQGLNGEKILVPGNHDKCHPANRKKQCSFRDYKDIGFKEVALQMLIELNIGGKPTTVKLCHLPYEPDDFEKADRRYMEMRPEDEGHLLLHGHVHNAFKMNVEKRMLNVGVDVWNFYPISAETIDKTVTENGFKL